ncbi:hypothetical protein ZWY2020_017910 [Hordeum vulgare]|uniref:Methyltransferase n=1 Tax=Hordeum vulgare subsp. vulgare TaxID=112509 RepID=A0A8I6YCX4_HORVV|nr:hypothetical protein ZWY2020_017910 [Hordeum vulgare]
MADQRRGHRLQSQGLGDAEDGRGTAELRQDIGWCGVARSSAGENKTRAVVLVLMVIGLCSFFYLLGMWQAKRVGGGDCISRRLTEETKCVTLQGLHVETHLVLGDKPSWR